MSRAERLLDLIQILRRYRTPVTAQTLADELGISVRTLYRDIVTLQGQGADIEGEPGLGYVLRPGFMLPPLMFSIDELEALALGTAWVGQQKDDRRLSAAAESAITKISAVLPDDLKREVEATTLIVGPRRNAEPIRVDPALFRDAIRKELKLRIDYADESGTATERVIWPFLIGFFEQRRVVTAWCELRNDFRSFRLDRIAGVHATGERMPRRRQALARQWRQKLEQEAEDWRNRQAGSAT